MPPERELAGQLAVSRATLREGLSILSQMGLLSIHRGRGGGAVVTAPPATTVSASIALLFQTRVVTAGQLCEFRRAFEVEAAQLAAERRSRPTSLRSPPRSMPTWRAAPTRRLRTSTVVRSTTRWRVPAGTPPRRDHGLHQRRVRRVFSPPAQHERQITAPHPRSALADPRRHPARRDRPPRGADAGPL